MIKHKTQSLLIFIVFLIWGGIIYSNTFTSSFQFDDFNYIVNNIDLRNITNISAIWGTRLGHASRFIGFLSFALNYHISGMNPIGFHITNFLIHVITTFLVWNLLTIFIKLTEKKYNNLISNSNKIAILAALLFLVHPVQTQAVTYITQRFASLATFFYISSLLLYLKGRLLFVTENKEKRTAPNQFQKKGNKKNKKTNKVEIISKPLPAPKKSKLKICLYLLGSLFCGTLGMMTKEVLITLPLMIIFIEWFFFDLSKFKKYFFPIMLPFISIALIIPAFFKFNIQGILFAKKMSESHQGDWITLGPYLFTQVRVWWTFIKLIFFPLNQNVDYDFPLSYTFSDPTVIIGFIGLLIILIIAIRMRKSYPLISFGIIWFFITLSPNLIPRRHVIFEHKLYLTAIGIFFAISALLFSKIKNITITRNISIALLLILSFLTFQRNQVWSTEISLWTDTLKKSPNKPRPLFALGSAYSKIKNYDKALYYFNKTIEIDPIFTMVYNHRGIIHEKNLQFDLALKDYQKAIQLDPNFVEAINNLANIYKTQGKYDLALENYNKALAINPRYYTSYFNRGALYYSTKDYQRALDDFNKALEINPDYEQVYNNRGCLFSAVQKYSAAMQDFDHLLKMNPNSADAYFNKGRTYHLMGEQTLALKFYDKTIKLNPSDYLAFFNRANLYSEMEEYAQAIIDYKKTIQLNPEFTNAYINLGNCYGRTSDFNNALKNFDEALKIDPENASIYFNRSHAYRALGQSEKAMNDLIKSQTLKNTFN